MQLATVVTRDELVAVTFFAIGASENCQEKKKGKGMNPLPLFEQSSFYCKAEDEAVAAAAALKRITPELSVK